MQLDAILEVAIGLIFAWLVLSVATMEVQNGIGQILGHEMLILFQSSCIKIHQSWWNLVSRKGINMVISS